MLNPPRIWLDYRPVRIGWVVPERSIDHLVSAASWNACLWGGRFNPVIPLHDMALADSLVRCFGVDVLIAAGDDAPSATFIDRFPHLHHERWRPSIFQQGSCEFADIRQALRQIDMQRDETTPRNLILPTWNSADPLHALFAVTFGGYPPPDASIADYRHGLAEFDVAETPLALAAPIPENFLGRIPPLLLTGYGLTQRRMRDGWLGLGIILGSAENFDELVLYWNLGAAGASVIFYDQTRGDRLRAFANAWIARQQTRGLGEERRFSMWLNRERPGDDSWRPDLNLEGLPLSLNDGRGEALWNGLNIEPQRPFFSAAYRDVVPSYSESDGKASVSFALPNRPFVEDDVRGGSQKFAVVIDAAQHSMDPDADLTFETPFVPELNEFYGRHFYHDYDAARSQLARLDDGAVALLTNLSTQRLAVSAFRVFDWMKAFFALDGIEIERSEPGLRCSRLIAQLGGLQACRVLKIRGVRALLRKYGVDQSFTRSGAIEAIRDVSQGSGAVGFDAFRQLYIEYRESGDLTPDGVLRFLLTHRVFRTGLELRCPNCQLPSWMHLDDVKTISTCMYCDHAYDVTPQLRDRDWRYRRSGIFGRDDNQLGGVPVALTLQQLAANLSDILLYSTALSFRGPTIDRCEADWVALTAGSTHRGEAPVQIAFGEAKSEGGFDAEDVRKLGRLADAVSGQRADAFVVFSKTGAFAPEEIRLAQTLNAPRRRRRVILLGQDELEPYHLYERSRERLGQRAYAVSFDDMANVTHRLYFEPGSPGS